MSAKQKAIDDIKKLGRMFKGIIDVADDLEKLASLEQAIGEAESRHKELIDHELKVNAVIDAAKAKLEEAEAKAKEIVEDANAQSLAIVSDANKAFSDMVGGAEAEAKRIVEEAEAKKAVIELEMREVMAKHDKIQEEVSAAEVKLAAIKAEVEAIKSRLGV